MCILEKICKKIGFSTLVIKWYIFFLYHINHLIYCTWSGVKPVANHCDLSFILIYFNVISPHLFSL